LRSFPHLSILTRIITQSSPDHHPRVKQNSDFPVRSKRPALPAQCMQYPGSFSCTILMKDFTGKGYIVPDVPGIIRTNHNFAFPFFSGGGTYVHVS